MTRAEDPNQMAAPQPNDPEDTLAPLLNPGSVAIIGASDNPARIGGRPLRYMRDAGFSGRIYPVNPNRESVQEIPAFATITEMPESVILAYAEGVRDRGCPRLPARPCRPRPSSGSARGARSGGARRPDRPQDRLIREHEERAAQHLPHGPSSFCAEA